MWQQRGTTSPFQILIEPRHGLDEGLLLCEFLPLLGEVAAYCEAVLDIGEEVDLIGDGVFFEDLFGFVAFGGGEDLVGFWWSEF